jgi:magnesium chelatase subunit I
MTEAEIDPASTVLPYSLIVGHNELRMALEIAYVSDLIGGVLAIGQRGTAKTTTVRAFTKMLVDSLPVTLPIGATDDRVLGGWQIDKLMKGDPEPLDGLLVEASESAAGILYIDEVNLLDDYLVNVILDVVSTGILSVQRDYRADKPKLVKFTLVGTMNPDEGALRPQLFDRFGLVATVEPVEEAKVRQQIIETVLRFDVERTNPHSSFIAAARREDDKKRQTLTDAKKRIRDIPPDSDTIAACARLAAAFGLVGHRGELMLVRAARARAAILGARKITTEHVQQVAKLALIHRRAGGSSSTLPDWRPEDDVRVAELIRKG